MSATESCRLVVSGLGRHCSHWCPSRSIAAAAERTLIDDMYNSFSPADQRSYLCSVDPDEMAHYEPCDQSTLFAIILLIIE